MNNPTRQTSFYLIICFTNPRSFLMRLIKNITIKIINNFLSTDFTDCTDFVKTIICKICTIC
jgi:hypothetical protein